MVFDRQTGRGNCPTIESTFHEAHEMDISHVTDEAACSFASHHRLVEQQCFVWNDHQTLLMACGVLQWVCRRPGADIREYFRVKRDEN
jgi:hypothetical protein